MIDASLHTQLIFKSAVEKMDCDCNFRLGAVSQFVHKTGGRMTDKPKSDAAKEVPETVVNPQNGKRYLRGKFLGKVTTV